MSTLTRIRNCFLHRRAWLCAPMLCLAVFPVETSLAQAGQSAAPTQPPDSSALVLLDSVVATVNNHAILASDLEDEIQLSVLDPSNGVEGTLTEQRALQELISRTLIEQQIRQEDVQTVEPSQLEVDARLEEIRKQLPACVRQNCASDAGWKAFLQSHALTSERAEAYSATVLKFFASSSSDSGRVSKSPSSRLKPTTTTHCVPQYASGEAIPSLDQVAPRIQEILLQQQVNVLFDNWLNNLREQGDVEVLDPRLASALEGSNPPAATESTEP